MWIWFETMWFSEWVQYLLGLTVMDPSSPPPTPTFPILLNLFTLKHGLSESGPLSFDWNISLFSFVTTYSQTFIFRRFSSNSKSCSGLAWFASKFKCFVRKHLPSDYWAETYRLALSSRKRKLCRFLHILLLYKILVQATLTFYAWLLSTPPPPGPWNYNLLYTYIDIPRAWQLFT